MPARPRTSLWAFLAAAALALGATTIVPAAGASSGGSISGVVTNAYGEPAPNICAKPSLDASPKDWSAPTDASGHYELTGLEPGNYHLYFDSCGFPEMNLEVLPQWYGAPPDPDGGINKSATIVVGPGSQQTLNLQMHVRGSISGTVTPSWDGSQVGVCPYAVADEGTAYAANHVGVDATGHYRIRALDTGVYRVRFADCDQPGLGIVWQWYPDSTEAVGGQQVHVTVEHDTPGVDVTLHRYGRLSVHATAGNAPIADMVVNVVDADGNVVSYTDPIGDAIPLAGSTDADGNWTTGHVPAGTYRLFFFDAGGRGIEDQWYNGASSLATAATVHVPLDVVTSVNAVINLPPSGPSPECKAARKALADAEKRHQAAEAKADKAMAQITKITRQLQHSVSAPKRKALEKKLAAAKVQLTKAQQASQAAGLETIDLTEEVVRLCGDG